MGCENHTLYYVVTNNINQAGVSFILKVLAPEQLTVWINTRYHIGNQGYRQRNKRGEVLLIFFQEKNLYAYKFSLEGHIEEMDAGQPFMKSQKNQINFIISNKINVAPDVTVLIKFSLGNDHAVRVIHHPLFKTRNIKVSVKFYKEKTNNNS